MVPHPILVPLFLFAPPDAGLADDPPRDPVAAARAELDAYDAALDAELDAGEADPPGPAMMPTDDAIRLFERRVGGDPRDFANRTVLGQLLLRKAKEDDDHAASARAVTVLRAALAANRDYGPARTHLAVALLAGHGFGEALELARESYQRNPRDTLALAAVGDALLELGRYDEADAAFAGLERQAGRPPAVLARLARSAELRGRRDRAVALIDEALAETSAAGADPQTRAWYASRRAQLAFDAGDLGAAERFHRRALDAVPDYGASRVGLAAVAAARGDLGRAAELYRAAFDEFGEPPMAAALGDVLAADGKPDEANAWWDRAEAGMAEEAKTAETAHLREVSRFLADHARDPARAVELARRDLEIRQDIYAQDTLAFALLRAGELEGAAEASEKALRLGARDANLFYHAGLIAAARGEAGRATELLTEALAINPRFDPRGAADARQTLDRLRGE